MTLTLAASPADRNVRRSSPARSSSSLSPPTSPSSASSSSGPSPPSLSSPSSPSSSPLSSASSSLSTGCLFSSLRQRACQSGTICEATNSFTSIEASGRVADLVSAGSSEPSAGSCAACGAIDRRRPKVLYSGARSMNSSRSEARSLAELVSEESSTSSLTSASTSLVSAALGGPWLTRICISGFSEVSCASGCGGCLPSAFAPPKGTDGGGAV
mmetsp:Transcript_87625/g.189792  ORF Transcript_87625/g.189792 Transcript_87625/m.189792 type:complete len:214 (+) Transcript_87625:281-922(+)